MHLSFRYWSATKNGKKAMTSAARVVVTDHDLVAVSWLLRFGLQTQAVPRVKRSLSITAHYANNLCRRQIEKSPLAQIEMSLSTVLVGEFWADDGDYDEPDGDRPDERVAGSGGEQDQSNGSRDADETWSASGVPAGQGVRQAWPAGAGVPEARPAEQSPP